MSEICQRPCPQMDAKRFLDGHEKIICKVYSVCNQKGGTAKTTSSVNLGIGLARAGKKVCLIDADAYAS